MNEPFDRHDYCVVDLETTGYSPEAGARIIEIGGVRIENGQVTRTFQEMVNPGHEIPPKITDLTGITDEDVKGAAPVDEVLPRFLNFRGESFFIAHNASFDLGFIRHAMSESIDDTHLDTVTMARRLYNFESNALTELIREFDLERDDAHRALDDALATAELFRIFTHEITEPEDYLRCQVPEPIRADSPYDFQLADGLEEDDITDPDRARQYIRKVMIQNNPRVGVNKWARILTGSRSQAIEQYRDHPAYGRLGDWAQKDVRSLIKESIEQGLLRKHGKSYPVLEPVFEESNPGDPLQSSRSTEPF